MRIHGTSLRYTPYSPHFTHGSPKYLGWILKLHDFGTQTHCIWMPNPMTLDAKLNDFAIQSLCFWKKYSKRLGNKRIQVWNLRAGHKVKAA